MVRQVGLLVALGVIGCSHPDAASRNTGLNFNAIMGGEALTKGDYAKALDHFNKAIQEDDTNPSFYINRGSCYSYLGRLDDALRDYDIAKKIIVLTGDPQDKRLASVYYNRGYAFDLAGDPKKGLAEYEKAIAVDPSYPDAHGNSAWTMATHPNPGLHDPKKALEYALIEAELSRKDEGGADVLDTVAAAYASNGQFDKACSYQEKVIAQAESPDDKSRFADRLRLYRQKKPYNEERTPIRPVRTVSP